MQLTYVITPCNPRFVAGLLPFLLLAVLGADVAQARRTRDGRIELRVGNVSQRSREGRRPGPDHVRDFMLANPDIKIVPSMTLEMTEGPGEGTELMAIAGGTAPDVFDLFGRKVHTYAERGFLAPLDRHLARYEQEHGEPYEGIWAPPAIWEACRHNGQFVAVPRAYYWMHLYWRKDLLRKAGLNAERGPQDWDELFRMGMALTDQGGERVIGGRRVKGRQYGFLLFGRAWTFTNFIWAAGGEIIAPFTKLPPENHLVRLKMPHIDFRAHHIRVREEEAYYATAYDQENQRIFEEIESDPEREIEWKLVINDPAGLEAYRFYRRLIWQPWVRLPDTDPNGRPIEFEVRTEEMKAGYTTHPITGERLSLAELERNGQLFTGVASVQRENDPDVIEQFIRGRVAMMLCWSGIISQVVAAGVSPDLIGQAPFPAGPGGQRANYCSGGYYAINSQSDLESQEAAWRYIEWVTRPEAQRMNLQYRVEEGTARFESPAALLRYGFTDILREIPRSWIENENEIVRHAHVEPYVRGAQTIYEHMGIPLERIEMMASSAEAFAYDLQAELDAIAKRVNTHILGKPSRADIQRKEWLAMVLLTVLAVFFVVMLVKAIRILASGGLIQAGKGGSVVLGETSKFRQTLYATLFLSVAMGSVLLWNYVPLAQGTIMAFYDWQLVKESRFVWLDNFVEVLDWENPELFWYPLGRTVLYVALSLGMGFFVPIVLAILLHEIPRGKMFFRTIYYLPAVTTGLVVLFLWKRLLYDPTEDGLLNQLIAGLWNPLVDVCNALLGTNLAHAEPFGWLKSTSLAMVCVILPGIWAGAGPGCLIYLAALKGVSEEEYEAAEIDGASILHKLRYITIPNLSALIIINFVGAFIGAFKAMEGVFVMTGGGPLRATHVIGIQVWYEAFMYLNFGLATAMAWILGSLLIGFTVYQLQVLKRVEFKAHGASAG